MNTAIEWLVAKTTASNGAVVVVEVYEGLEVNVSSNL
jgi:hypothetical protein